MGVEERTPEGTLSPRRVKVLIAISIGVVLTMLTPTENRGIIPKEEA